VRLLESDKRKAAFLRECRGRIPSIHIENARSAEYRRSSEFWVCRAVKAAEAIECCSRLGGRLALMISADAAKKLTETGALEDASTTPLPWRSDSVILIGEPQKKVPRGTPEA
jgi:16S rRNA G527 N7-methylase RsmG